MYSAISYWTAFLGTLENTMSIPVHLDMLQNFVFLQTAKAEVETYKHSNGHRFMIKKLVNY